MDELKRLQSALLASGCVVYERDLDTHTLTWSGNINGLLGVEGPEDIATMESYTNKIIEDDREHYTTMVHSSDYVSGNTAIEYRIDTGKAAPLWVSDKPTVVKEEGKHILVGIIMPKYISHMTSSPLTNGDKTACLELLGNAIKETISTGMDGLFVLLSIDNFATLMSWYDVETAEEAMSDIQDIIAQMLEDKDHVERLGVDQFCIILSDYTDEALEQLIGEIHKSIKLYANPSFKEEIVIRCSSGGVKFPGHSNSPEEIVDKAYMALCSSKDQTAKAHTDYHEAKQEQLLSKEQVSMMNHMKEAINQDKLKLAYQPVFTSTTGKIVSYECLLRIVEGKEVRSAGAFIPVAEKMGFIDIIDTYVLGLVVEELKENKDLVLNFNVSNMTTDNPKWLKSFNNLLKDESIASRTIVEITETAAQRDMRQTAYFVASLQALGCKVALDDFGAGYTSFRQLKSLSVDMVKIDGAYIQDLAENTENILFIKTLLDFSKSYGLETVAECVETGEVAKILMDLGVDYMQGYYFGEPQLERL